ncbi:MAG: hypothetical protein J2O39_08965, partial [Acidimicrobiales bacterium]|nr:hypothetical protein [Acidimicrobiales bacterium]
LLFVALEPQLAVAYARNAERETPRRGLTIEILTRWDEEQRSTMRGLGLHLDTSSLTADETADQILCGRSPEFAICNQRKSRSAIKERRGELRSCSSWQASTTLP